MMLRVPHYNDVALREHGVRSQTQVLAQRLAASERPSFEAVVRRHYASVYAQLWCYCRDREIAEDLTQETFIEAWKSVASLRDYRSARAWLYTIARRVWHRWSQSPACSRSSLNVPLVSIASVCEDPTAGPERILTAVEKARIVRAALGRLPLIYREALELRYFQDLKRNEIAAILSLPAGTVAWRLHEGLHRLEAELMEPELIEALR
jgi:RNA polymerase sigma-70 factor, ECF subfamily